jgi:hypothetical protein
MTALRTPAGILRAALAAAVVLSLAGFAIALGPSRALRIAGAAAASVVVDGFAEQPGPHRMPVLELEVPQGALDSLAADLPWSGGTNVPALLRNNGVEHRVRFRYRGAVTPSHFLGGKKSFRLSMKRSNPWAPYRKVNVINPKAHNLVNDHLAAWVAGTMGVPVPLNELVFTRINGQDIGVMELYEQVDGAFESNRHLVPHEVPVYKGDYPPISGRALPKGRTLWADADHWAYESDADSTTARRTLERLVAALRKDTLPAATHRDSLAALIDVETYLRFEAARLVLNTVHIDQYHNQWLVLNPRTGRFYPVLWDALLMFAPPGEPLYHVHDALSWWICRIPEWRLQRDRYAHQAMVHLHREGAFDRRLDAVMARIRPSVLADRNKHGNVTLLPEDVHRVSLLHVIGSTAGLRSTAHGYWERMLERMERSGVQFQRTDSALRIRSSAEAPLRLTWSGAAEGITLDGQPAAPEPSGDGWSLTLHRTLVPDGGKDHPLADRQRYHVAPLDATVAFPQGIPASLVVTNAITDEPVE